MNRRIGLLGGSFDPPHLAHLALAQAALHHLALDELRWLPVGDPWQKQRRPAGATDREAMVRLAIAGEPRFSVDDRELRRAGASYTVDTLRELQAAEQADWFLVLGQDQYANLHTWCEWPEVLQRVTLAVAARDGIPPQAGEPVAATPHRMQVVPLPRLAVSATEVRERIAAGRDYTDMVPGAVARYIDQHHLYRGNPRS